MRYFEVEGDTPDLILVQFLNQQDIPSDYVEYEIIDPGSKGVFGIGKRKAKLKIKYNDGEHIKRKSRMMLADLLEKAGFNDAHVATSEDGDKLILNIEMGNPDILIGKMAQTLDSIQYLMDKMLKLDDEAAVRVIIDVCDYRKRTVQQNVEKALSLAEQVKKTGRTIKMSPMTTMIRKEIHIALKNVSGVSTISAGEGQIKQICIVPEKKSTGYTKRS